MAIKESNDDLDGIIDEVFASSPLIFVREFLRAKKTHSKQIHIGVTRKEVRANLRDAILAKRIGRAEVTAWLQDVEGWGKQHLYLGSVRKRSLTQAHLLNSSALHGFLKKKGFLVGQASDQDPDPLVLADVQVDDELVRINWRSHATDPERRKELDEIRDLDDGLYEFRAYRLNPRRSACRLIIRKTDGIVLTLVDLPLESGHDLLKTKIDEVAKAVLAPLSIGLIPIAPIVRALDEGAVAAFGPKPERRLTLGVAPTQSRFRADGASLEFKTTRESSGYTDCDAVRRVRKAMQIEKFEGETGKFRLTFEGEHREPHNMVVSLSAAGNRVYLFSRMTEKEILSLVDQLISLA